MSNPAYGGCSVETLSTGSAINIAAFVNPTNSGVLAVISRLCLCANDIVGPGNSITLALWRASAIGGGASNRFGSHINSKGTEGSIFSSCYLRSPSATDRAAATPITGTLATHPLRGFDLFSIATVVGEFTHSDKMLWTPEDPPIIVEPGFGLIVVGSGTASIYGMKLNAIWREPDLRRGSNGEMEGMEP